MSVILVFGIGLAAGLLLNRLLSRGQRKLRDLERQLTAAHEEHAAYRKEVSEHFTRTALAVNQLTENYRAVHAHLRDGAQRLCDTPRAETALAFDASRLIGSDLEPVQSRNAGAGHQADTAATTPAAGPGADASGTPGETPQHAAERAADAPPRDYAEAILEEPRRTGR
jgi:hypothetical protein